MKILGRVILLTAALSCVGAEARPADPPLVLEAKIPLGPVGGRIDHLAVALKRQLLFVAELGNDGLGVIDLAVPKLRTTITGFSKPQGVGYEPEGGTVYVANAGDGSVRLFRGEDFTPLGRIDLGDDADNVRVDRPRKRVLVGYGKGAIAVIDPVTRAKVTDYRLRGHPEGFQIDGDGARVFVNVPDTREIAIVDLSAGQVHATPIGGLRGNFPMAVDTGTGRILAVFRSPPTLAALSSPDGRMVAKTDTCGDADDVFVDQRRGRVYVSCGEGFVDVFERLGDGYARLAKVPTVSGARTSLFVPEFDRLFVAVPASRQGSAAVWVFRPPP